jgi:dTDP-4-amino-4,6-dideoxygalactose transaminase
MAAKLALDGGPRTVPEGMIQSWPPVTQADRERVLQVFDNNQFHTNGAPFAQELQRRWAEYCGVRFCLSVNGGTSALHMAVAAAGVRPGDEVITSAYSYWATAASILHQNAIPVFVDVDPRTATMDPTQIEDAITDRTTAIFPVHIHGMPADLDPILAVARKHGLPVISDCCQAHGARYKGKPVGGVEDIAGFSLNRSKNLSGGEGGLVTTDNEDFHRRLEAVFGFREVTVATDEGDRIFAGLGQNYRPHEFINAFVCSQLDRFEEMNGQRRAFANTVTSALEEIPGVAGPHVPEYADPCYWSYLFEVRPAELGLDLTPLQFRGALLQALQAEGVPAGGPHEPVPQLAIFQDKVGHGKGCPWTCRFGRDIVYRMEDYPATQTVFESRALLGGLYPPNDMELVKLYVDAFRKVSENLPRVLELVIPHP